MRHYDDRDYAGDICAPRLKCTWFDWACMIVFTCVVVYGLVHRWLHWL